jgi:hypothetical protein
MVGFGAEPWYMLAPFFSKSSTVGLAPEDPAEPTTERT